MRDVILRSLLPVVLIALLLSFRRNGKTDNGDDLTALIHSGSMPRTDTFLANLLRKHPAYFSDILENRDSYRVQVIYTRIDRMSGNVPKFKDYYFNVDAGLYFYPASTVKMPVALLALQRVNELKIKGLTMNSAMLTGAAYSGQQEVLNDPSSLDGSPSIAQYIRKIFLVSDNDAYNRLYEFLGMDYINEQLHKKGYLSSQIRHRLERSLTEDENRHTNPVWFIGDQGKELFRQPMKHSKMQFSPRNDLLGEAHYRQGVLREGPFDFSQKNRLALEDLHGILKAALFPEAVPASRRFGLTASDYQFIRKCMGQYPRESAYPSYDTTQYWDTYCKFVYGGSEKKPLPATMRIFNKVGDAYGFLLDVAYVVDFSKNIEFMVSAVIYCNSDGIINDSRYDYEKVGYPFMKNLGKVLYAYESSRKRSRIPDLSAFRMNFQK